jgi:hypothetical protein
MKVPRRVGSELTGKRDDVSMAVGWRMGTECCARDKLISLLLEDINLNILLRAVNTRELVYRCLGDYVCP